MHVRVSSLRHGWGLAAVCTVLMGVSVALGFVLTDRQYLVAMKSFVTVSILVLMVKVAVTGLRGRNGHS